MEDRIKINVNGVIKEADVISCFKFKGENNKYVIYSFNELDKEGKEILYASKVLENKTSQDFVNVTAEEYKRLENIMKAMVREED